MKKPHFVIDFGLFPYHSFREKKLLLKQIQLSIAEIRKFYSDEHLTLASFPEEFLPEVVKMKFKGGILSGKFISRELIVMDPHSKTSMSSFDAEKIYLIGGIVDKSRSIKTQNLWYDAPSQKIEFENSKVGVPDRINLIIRILCETSKGKSLDSAILENMPRREKSERINMEDSRGKSIVEISKLLRITESEVKKFIRP